MCMCFIIVKKDFIKYLDDWTANSIKLEGLPKSEKLASCISKETLEGLCMAGILHACNHVNHLFAYILLIY